MFITDGHPHSYLCTQNTHVPLFTGLFSLLHVTQTLRGGVSECVCLLPLFLCRSRWVPCALLALASPPAPFPWTLFLGPSQLFVLLSMAKLLMPQCLG